MCPSFPFSIDGGMWDVIVLIPDHCLSIYFLGGEILFVCAFCILLSMATNENEQWHKIIFLIEIYTRNISLKVYICNGLAVNTIFQFISPL